MNRDVIRAVLQLIVAGVLWGFSFVGVTWALRELNPFEIAFVRFSFTFLEGFLLQMAFRSWREWREAIALSFLAGVLLSATLLLQTVGLQYTTATKSGFITTLYVVMVPLAESVINRRPVAREHWMLVFVALVGTSLIMRLDFEAINAGDLFTLLAAVFATAQVLWIARVSRRTERPFLFNAVQFGWSALLALPFVSPPELVGKLSQIGQWSTEAVIGILFLSVGSTSTAFYFQVKAQRHLSATTASLLFLLESPFAAIFAMIFLHERLSYMEWVGAALIFGASIVVSLREARH